MKQGSTGNLIIDMIGSAMKHYKDCGRTVKIVNVAHSHWDVFRRYLEKQNPDLEIDSNGIQFNNVLIRRGSRFQALAIKCELNPIITKEEAAKVVGFNPKNN